MAEAKTQTHEETWTALGVRRLQSGKLGHCWLDEDGREVIYTKLRGSAGNTYTVSVRDGDDGRGVVGRPQYVGQHPDRDERRRWAAEDRAAQVSYDAERQAAKRGDELHVACEPLRRLMIAQRTAPARRALLASILEELRV